MIIIKLINHLLSVLNLVIVFRIGKALGDQLCITGYLRKKKYQNKRFIVITNNRDFFLHNPEVILNIGIKSTNSFILKILRKARSANIIYFNFYNNDSTLEDFMRETSNKLHLIDLHSNNYIKGTQNFGYRNEIFFSKIECQIYKDKFKDISDFAIIHPYTKKSYTPNKQWEIEKFQEVVDKLPTVKWIQLGRSNETLLKNVIDFREKLSMREIFFLIKHAKFLLSCEGFFNHVSSAFYTPSFVVLSGFHDKSIAHYANTIFIENQDVCHDSPCWLTTECKYQGRPCLGSIKSDDVVRKINEVNLHN